MTGEPHITKGKILQCSNALFASYMSYQVPVQHDIH